MSKTTDAFGQTWEPSPKMASIRLSEAIRKGCVIRPRQIRGEVYDNYNGSCVMGAVLDGLLGERAARNEFWNYHAKIRRAFPELQSSISECTGNDWDDYDTLWDYLVRLNNNTENRMTREQIAYWLEVQGL